MTLNAAISFVSVPVGSLQYGLVAAPDTSGAKAPSELSIDDAFVRYSATGDYLSLMGSAAISRSRCDRSKLDTVAQQARDWLEAGNWQTLDAALTKKDRDGVKTADGNHLSKEVMGAVWAHVTQGIPSRTDECGQTLMAPVPFERVEPLLEAVKKHPDSVVINSLVAWLCIQIGWTYRGGDYADHVSDAQFEKMDWMLQTADNFLNRFDPLTAGSPMLARIRYHRTAGINTTLDQLKAAFETCMRLAGRCIIQSHGPLFPN